MAKLVSLSDDSRVSWEDLPGATGAFATEAESITDTVFGNTYQSSEIGLLGWSVSANAFFKGFAGYLAEISEPGTPTAMATEACSQVTGQIYQIDDLTKQVIDRSFASTVVFDNAIDHSADVESIDYLFGRITFNVGYSITEPVTITSEFLPLTQLGKGQSYTLTMTADAVDNTDFATAQGNGGYRTFEPGLRTVALELGGIFDSTVNSKADLAARGELIVTLDPAGDKSSLARGFFKLVTTGQSGDVGALEEETISLELTVPVDAEFAIEYPFSWQHTGTTTLDESIKIALQAFLDETIIDVRYLPVGLEGETPLDGVEGLCVVTDVSLSGGLSDMNTFTIDVQGSGAFVEV